MRTGSYIFAPPYPFVPGYEAVGVVDKLGPGVTSLRVGQRVAGLLVHGGAEEYVVRKESAWVPVEPDDLPADQVVALVLNYVTAYQAIHRCGLVKPGQTALVTTANGGVGLAMVELLVGMGVRVLAACGSRHHDALREAGAEPVPDSRSGTPVDVSVRRVVKGGVDVSFDGVGGVYAMECLRATRVGGRLVGFGFAGTQDKRGNFSNLKGVPGFLTYFIVAPLRLRRGTFYGITAAYRSNPKPFRDDFAALCKLLSAGRVRPRIARRFGLLEFRDAEALLEKGGVNGKIVLLRESAP